MFEVNFLDYGIELSKSKFEKFLKSLLFRNEDNKFKKTNKTFGFDLDDDIYYHVIIESLDDNFIFYFSLDSDNYTEFDIKQSFDFYVQLLLKKFILKERKFYSNNLELFKFIEEGNEFIIDKEWKLIDLDVINEQITLINKKKHLKLVLELNNKDLDYFYHYFDIIKTIKIIHKNNLIKIKN